MKKWILMVMAAAFTLSVSACSTVKGVGQDVSAVGATLIPQQLLCKRNFNGCR